ncbi:MAG TPA: polyprenyl synthetase family protein [candidate division Zixibacteria bacterium]|nr:polyprenyl synthetase family protein [candidate division Zixibacteria bacterium]
MGIQLELIEVMQNVQKELSLLFKENGMKRKGMGIFGDLFYNEFNNYLTNGGKRIRPFLVITAFEAVGGDPSKGNIARASLAIELLHNGSLFHDDVIDKDETRRGKPSFHVVFRDIFAKKKNDSANKSHDFGEAMAIFAGDLCFPFAIESIIQSGFPPELSLKALHAFTEAFKDVIDGVIIETGDTIEPDSSEENYNLMVHLKTGALIRKAVEIGAILGQGTESQVKALTDFCESIGRAFQIQDDILGIFGDPEEIGKPVGGDIRENKQTILRIYAMKNGTKKQIKRLTQLMGNDDVTQKELEEVRTIFKETGSLDYSLNLIQEATECARNSLEIADPPLKNEPKQKLIALANYLSDRKK